jgi:uncharacterized cupredoxin-like copper-binding protein
MTGSRLTITALSLAVASAALAHDPSHTKHESKTFSDKEHAVGRQGDAKKVSYTVKVEMSDTMRFSPSLLHVKRGDTVRFDVTNSGKTMHEMVLGTMEELKQHAALMRKHSGMHGQMQHSGMAAGMYHADMQHDESHMAHVDPGKRRAIVWQFTKPGEFYYACLIPGHFETGMIGKVVVR